MNYTPSKNETVNNYLAALDTDLKDLFLKIRNTVLKAAPNLQEDIKWKNCLTYSLNKNIIQTVLGKQHISLIFFEGKQLNDPEGILFGEGNKTKTAKITPQDFKSGALAKLVKQAVQLSNS